MSKTKKLQMVLVDWVDAVFDNREPPPPLKLHTIGFLCQDAEDYITVAMERGDDHEEYLRDFVTIPRPYISRITKLKKVKNGN